MIEDSAHVAWRARILLFLITLALCVATIEVTARAFWLFRHGVPFLEPSRILFAYYPELRGVERNRPSRTDGLHDILLLGGSALHRDWGQVEQELAEQLAYAGHRDVRIFNLAMPAQTSRDSWLKYASLPDARFELVAFYHGINDARANNAPPNIFREDYSHYSWYETVNALAPYHGSSSFASLYTLRFFTARMRQRIMSDRYVPTYQPRSDWVQYGRHLRSVPSFERNVDAILDQARLRGDRVLLMTFATYVPEDYSQEAFAENSLDYGLHLRPIEIWGRRENVLAAVAAHNAVLRRKAADHEGVLFVDQAHLMIGSGRNFNDVCHLTTVGSARFVEHMLAAVLPTLADH